MRLPNFIALIALLAGLTPASATPIPELISRRATSLPANVTGDGPSTDASFAGDGRYVFFASAVPNLATNDANGARLDVFRRDLLSGTTELVSLGPDGRPWSNAVAFDPSASADGTKVAFSVRAFRAPPGDPRLATDIYVRDLTVGVTALVSARPDGAGPGNGQSRHATISGDGRFAVFESEATDLVSGADTNNATDVFLRDLQAGTTLRLSEIPNWRPDVTGVAYQPIINADGSTVLFSDSSFKFRPIPQGNSTDLFLWRRGHGSAQRVMLPEKFAFPQIPVWAAMNAELSVDGRFVTFWTHFERDAAGGFKMADWHIWWLDVDSGIPVVAFKGGRESGGPLFGVGGSSYPDLGEVSVMSNDGQTLAFSLTVTNDTIPGHRISLWTPKSGLKTLDESAMTLPPGGAEPMTSKWPLLSPDGRKLAFVTQDAVPSAGVTEGGTLRLFVRTLATGRTVALPEADYGWAYPEFSPDGSKLLFQTVSTLGFEGDRNEDLDVFVVDTETGNPTLVSTLPNTAASVTPSKLSGAPRLSVDGRYVFYASMADDLVVGDTNGVWDIFRYDRRTGETKGVSTFPNGVPGGAKALLDVSPNGRLVLFSSFQPGFAEGDTNGLADGFLKDMETGVLTLVSVFDPNRPESGISPVISGRMSDDGRFIVYDQDVGSGQISTLRDLVGGQSWVLTRSRSPDEMPRVSNYMPSLISADGKVVTFVFRTETNGVWSYLRDSDEMRAIDESKPKSEVSFVNQLNVSRNGRWIAYEDGLRNKASLGLTLRVKDLVMHTSRAIPLGDFSTRDLELSDTGGLVFSTAAPLPGSADDNRLKDVFFYDFNADLLWLVSRSSGGRAGVGGESGSPRISRDGRYIVFRSSATNLIDGDVNGTADIFIHDSASDTITLLSGDAQGTGPGNGPSYGPAISADAGVVAFFSQADNMAANDFNGLPDIFAVEPKRIDPLPLKPVRLSASGSRWARFQWWSNSGTRYVVRATSNLASGDWKQVGPELVGTGGTLVFDEPRDPNRFTPPARFYQVIEVR